MGKVGFNKRAKLPPTEPVQHQFCSLGDFKKFIKGKRIAVVANSSDLLGKNLGTFIDSHDIVVRFNSYLLKSDDTGTKTHIHAMIWLQEYNMHQWVPYRIIFSGNRGNWERFIKTKVKPESQTSILEVTYPLQDSRFPDFKEYPTGAPTTGFNTIRLIHALGGYKDMNLFGFTFYETGHESIFRIDEAMKTHQISKVHRYDLEKEWVMSNSIEIDALLNIIKI